MKGRSGETAEARDVFVDARTVADGEVVEADVCVAGGGVAGLATALELEEAGVRVALVERGGSPVDGEVEGSYPPLASTRAGGLGGTAALWTAELAPGRLGARYAPLAPIDFEAREGIPSSGWPFGRAHLEPFYARARELCRAGPFPLAGRAAAARRVRHPARERARRRDRVRPGRGDAAPRGPAERRLLRRPRARPPSARRPRGGGAPAGRPRGAGARG